jgi:hypothetical protein
LCTRQPASVTIARVAHTARRTLRKALDLLPDASCRRPGFDGSGSFVALRKVLQAQASPGNPSPAPLRSGGELGPSSPCRAEAFPRLTAFERPRSTGWRSSREFPSAPGVGPHSQQGAPSEQARSPRFAAPGRPVPHRNRPCSHKRAVARPRGWPGFEDSRRAIPRRSGAPRGAVDDV